MPGGRPSRKLIAIREKDGTINYRWVGGGYQKPATIKRYNTKWASCEIGNKSEPSPPQFGPAGITSTGFITYGTNVFQPVVVTFNEPCPLGKPPKPPKKPKAKEPKQAGKHNTRR